MVEIVEYPKVLKWKVKCEHCGCTLKFSEEDVQHKTDMHYSKWLLASRVSIDYVICPYCKREAKTLITEENECDSFTNDYRSDEFYE